MLGLEWPLEAVESNPWDLLWFTPGIFPLRVLLASAGMCLLIMLVLLLSSGCYTIELPFLLQSFFLLSNLHLPFFNLKPLPPAVHCTWPTLNKSFLLLYIISSPVLITSNTSLYFFKLFRLTCLNLSSNPPLKG